MLTFPDVNTQSETRRVGASLFNLSVAQTPPKREAAGDTGSDISVLNILFLSFTTMLTTCRILRHPIFRIHYTEVGINILISIFY